jgi:hypothetical protein
LGAGSPAVKSPDSQGNLPFPIRFPGDQHREGIQTPIQAADLDLFQMIIHPEFQAGDAFGITGRGVDQHRIADHQFSTALRRMDQHQRALRALRSRKQEKVHHQSQHSGDQKEAAQDQESQRGFSFK